MPDSSIEQPEEDIKRYSGFCPVVPDGIAVYAVGDIHGRLDLLRPLIGKIQRDLQENPAAKAKLIFLGDYIDRGRYSQGVIDYLLAIRNSSEFDITILSGNHERLFLDFLADPATAPAWMDCGGGDTLASYGISVPNRREPEAYWIATRDALLSALPASHIDFLESLPLYETVGDYIFVHAGLRRGVPLDRQTERDLLWLRSEACWDCDGVIKAVVHGHTPTSEPVVTAARINVDTGAYATGRLTAIRLEGAARRVIDVRNAVPGPMMRIPENAA